MAAILVFGRNLSVQHHVCAALDTSGYSMANGFQHILRNEIRDGLTLLHERRDACAVITALHNPLPNGERPEYNGLALLKDMRHGSCEKCRRMPIVVVTTDAAFEHDIRSMPPSMLVCKHDFDYTERVVKALDQLRVREFA